MSKTIKVVVYERHGNPADVLQIKTEPWPKAERGEAVVALLAAPINPADLNAIEGKYPGRREVPAVPGFEGAGVIVDLAAASPSAVGPGSDTKNLSLGDLVILPHHIGTWRDAVAVKTDELVVVPAGIKPVHAATLKINPLTAWRLLHGYVELKSGDWLIQNAANSAAGRAVLEIARELGYKTINVVRRAELIDHGKDDGIDGLYSAIGGKWTTSRHLAENVVNAIVSKLGKPARRCTTATSRFPTPGDSNRDEEVLVAIHWEMAMTLEDVVMRRTSRGQLGDPGPAVLEQIASTMANELGWNETRKRMEIETVRKKFRTQTDA